MGAFSSITPASSRSTATPARPLPSIVAPVLRGHLNSMLGMISDVFPAAAVCLSVDSDKGPRLMGGNPPLSTPLKTRPTPSAVKASAAASLARAEASSGDDEIPDEEPYEDVPARCLPCQRPRMLLCGREGSGQSHLAPAVLYSLEGLPVHAIGLPSLLSDASARSPEEALVHAVVEARRAAPAVLYLPHFQLWWETAPPSLRSTLWMLLADLPSSVPLLLLASADCDADDLDAEALNIFSSLPNSCYQLSLPTDSERREFFKDLVDSAARQPPRQDLRPRRQLTYEALPLAPDALAEQEAEARERRLEEVRAKHREDHGVLRSLRMALRDITTRLLCDRRWRMFSEPPDPEEEPEYWEVVEKPMYLAAILSRVDQQAYPTPAAFLEDVALIPRGFKQYFKDDSDLDGLRIISKACALEDTARELVNGRVHAELARKCEAILAKGGPTPLPPEDRQASRAELESPLKPPNSAAVGTGGSAEQRRAATRASARLRGEQMDHSVIFEDPERLRRRLQEEKQRRDQQPDSPEAAPGSPAPRSTPTGADHRGALACPGSVIAETPQTGFEDGGREDEAVAGSAERDHACATEIHESDLGRGGSQADQQHREPEVDGGGGNNEQDEDAEEEDAGVENSDCVGEARPEDAEMAFQLQDKLVKATAGLNLDNLEALHASLTRITMQHRRSTDRRWVMSLLESAALAATSSSTGPTGSVMSTPPRTC